MRLGRERSWLDVDRVDSGRNASSVGVYLLFILFGKTINVLEA